MLSSSGKPEARQTLVVPTQQSNTKRTLIQLLQKQTELLRVDIIQQSQQALIKQLAKRKVTLPQICQVIYKLSRKNQLELVYAYIALSQHYLAKNYLEAAFKNLQQSLDILQTGDALFLLGQTLFNQNKLQQAKTYLESSLQTQWIQPSIDHQVASRLQCMTFLQKIYFTYGIEMKPKLLELSDKKIKETQKLNTGSSRKSDNYFMALSMADLAIIHEAFEEYDIALQKISAAITMLEASGQDPEKLMDFYLLKAGLYEKIHKKNFLTEENFTKAQSQQRQQKDVLMKGYELIDRYDLNEEKVVSLLEKLIKVNIF